MKLGLLGPLGHSAIANEDDRTDHFIPPLYHIDKVELELRIIRHRFHPLGSPLQPMMVCWLQSDRIMAGQLHRSVETGCGSPGLLTCGLIEGAMVAGLEERSDGDPAGIPTTETNPEVVSGRS